MILFFFSFHFIELARHGAREDIMLKFDKKAPRGRSVQHSPDVCTPQIGAAGLFSSSALNHRMEYELFSFFWTGVEDGADCSITSAI